VRKEKTEDKLTLSSREKGFNFRNILVIGSKARAKEIIGTIKKNGLDHRFGHPKTGI